MGLGNMAKRLDTKVLEPVETEVPNPVKRPLRTACECSYHCAPL